MAAIRRRGCALSFGRLRVPCLPILGALLLLCVLRRQRRSDNWLRRVERRFGACIALLGMVLLVEVRGVYLLRAEHHRWVELHVLEIAKRLLQALRGLLDLPGLVWRLQNGEGSWQVLRLGRAHNARIISVCTVAIGVRRGYLGRICRVSRRLLHNLPHLHLLVAIDLVDEA